MLTLITFIASGVLIIILIIAKVWEEKNRKSFFVLRGISKGDAQIRELSQNAAHIYADWREKIRFIVKRQLPLHTKNTLNKTITLVGEKSKQYIGDIKEGRMFGKKSEGISEFLKDISEMEKENGAVENEEGEGSQNKKDQVK